MKRFFEILLILIVLIPVGVILIILGVLVRINLGAPVFFKQKRAGKDGQQFEMIKFRTMRESYDSSGVPLPDAQRMTSFGNFLRSSSLDELPELWNVLKGEMSLVGPRPLLMQYLPLYSKEQARRHEVKPGITGWAQVNGRNNIGWDEKFALDVWYVDNRSSFLDVKILWLTIKKVLIRDGISSEGNATMSEFTGSKKNEENK
ncbi:MULTISPECIES: sugar transferase [Comamonas]|uniref:sugar transferase n=1 Tax=Comamonas thiooxydans TaxID=363952 RepID=UPI0021142117|nr:sugar transferase [Comamonas thiooxydans]UUE92265.1 sugar transferase [Comamonas thiooxydans]